MTPPSAATERGHSMPDYAVTLRDGALVWVCPECGLKAVRYREQEYGSACEADCVGAAA